MQIPSATADTEVIDVESLTMLPKVVRRCGSGGGEGGDVVGMADSGLA